jgi:hypothetical protein
MHQTEQHAHRRRLARAVRTQEPEHAATRHAQREGIHRDDIAVPFGQVVRLDHEVEVGFHTATASVPTFSANWL